MSEPLSKDDFSKFWVNVGFSTVIGLMNVCLAPAIAHFYQEPRLTWITIVLAGDIVVSSFGAQHATLLQRQMQYSKLSGCEILAQLLGVGLAIIAASQGIGCWALGIGPVVTAIVLTLGAIVSCKCFPEWPQWGSEIFSMLKFGSNLTEFGVIDHSARNVDNIFIDKYIGSIQPWPYVGAHQLPSLPMNQINGPIRDVAVPLPSCLASSPEKYRKPTSKSFKN